MPPVVGSVGFPTNYPYAQSMPLPSAILRPLQQPLYDTETLATGTAVAEKIFFQRQLGQSDAAGTISSKTIVDTNLQQPGQLANPLEFSLFGFTFEVDASISLLNFRTIYNGAAFVFTYTGNRVYLQIPLFKIPQGLGAEGFAGTTVADAGNIVVKNGVGHVSNLYKFTIGRSALRIRPTESFQAKLVFRSSIQATTNVVYMRVYIHGLQWTPL